MNIVLDTNVLVSAIWSPGRNAGEILNSVFAKKHTACYDHRILDEYYRVLHYKKFHFSEWEINAVLDPIIKDGLSVIADPLMDIPFSDESDRKFYEVSRFCHAVLITGNQKHYPEEPTIIALSDSCGQYLRISTDDPWEPARQVIGTFPSDFMSDREQPSWADVPERVEI